MNLDMGKEDLFKYYNHLGFHNPFFVNEGEMIKIYSDLTTLNEKNVQKNFIDFSAVAQTLIKGYPFGNRTLIKGVSKTPWMAKVNQEDNDWEYYNVPDHYEECFNHLKISEELFGLLKEEMLMYIEGKVNIGVLLTGGMDSRIVACVLNQLRIDQEINLNVNIVGITWGLDNSRDVVYASQIAKQLQWDWIHFKVDAEQMFQNIELTVQYGCEFSPIHLHAMQQVASIKNVDCIIAGSFGDSIGRGEYSGVKIEDLTSSTKNFLNIGGLFRSDFLKYTFKDTLDDVNYYHSIFPQEKKYQQYEQDLQIHYMRRMLNSCMSVINKDIPLFQMFSSPKVFGYMWSIHPTLRNDYIYKNILETKCKPLLEIPWARNGLKFPNKHGKPDFYRKDHHDYGNLIRSNILPEIKKYILSEDIHKLNIFNFKNLSLLVDLCENRPIKNFYFYEEKLIWIASLAIFVERFNLQSHFEPSKDRIFTSNNLIQYGKYFGRYLKNNFL